MGMGHLFPLVHLGPRVGDQKIVAVTKDSGRLLCPAPLSCCFIRFNYYQRRMGMVDATVLNFGSQAIRQTSMLLRR